MEKQVATVPNWSDTRYRRARDLMVLGFLLFRRDFQYRFKLTYFGYSWACLRPLLVGVPIILVGSQFNFAAGADLGVPYPLFAFAGMLMWQVFWDALFYPQWVMRRTRRLLSRVRFPYKAILAAACFYVGFNAVFYTMMLAGALVLFGASPGVGVFYGLLSLPLIAVSGLAIGALIAPLNLVYLDLRYGLPLLSSLLIWTAPIFYVTPESGPLHTINKWNPLTYLVDVPRAWFTGGLAADFALFVATIAGFLVLSALSLHFYERTVRIGVDEVL